MATTEVASILTMMDSVLDSNVYGVQLPGQKILFLHGVSNVVLPDMLI